MDTKVFYAAIIAIAIGGAIWQGAGFADLFVGSSPGEDLDSTARVAEDANESALDGNFTGDASSSDGNLVGLIISGIQEIFAIATFILFLPGELLELGLPEYAARPIGNMAVIFGTIGLIQLAIGRVWN